MDSPQLTTALPVDSPRKAGRPRKREVLVNYAELDQLLVFGEVVDHNGGKVEYPTYRELAARFGVVTSVVADYARKNRCVRRRKQVAVRIRARVEEKRVESRADAIAHRKDEVARPFVVVLRETHREVLDERRSASIEQTR